MNKYNFEPKFCPVCERSFDWRKKWEKNWNKVIYCSKKCKMNKKNKKNNY